MFKLTFINKMHSLYVILYIYWIGFYYSVTELLHDFLSPKVDLKGYLVNNTDVPLICVLTGGEGTIGRKICSQLLDLGFEIYSLLPQTDSQIKKGNNLLFGNNHPRIHYVSCDLSNLQSVKKACNKLNSQLSHIDILICNAGIMCATDNRTASMNDLNIYEPHVSVNLLGHAAITHSLRSLILQSPNGRTSRILYVSSSTAHAGIVPSKDDILKGTFLKHYDSGYQAYANSKLWLIMYGKYLTSQYYHKLDNTNLDKVNGKMLEVGSLHPGVIPGALYRNVLPLFRYIICNILNVFLRNNERAAQGIIKLGLDHSISLQGNYFENDKICSIKSLSNCNSEISNIINLFGEQVDKAIKDHGIVLYQ